MAIDDLYSSCSSEERKEMHYHLDFITATSIYGAKSESTSDPGGRYHNKSDQLSESSNNT